MTRAISIALVGVLALLPLAAAGCEHALDAPARRIGGALACAPACDADADCDPGSLCVARRCVRPADRDRCTIDVECGLVRTFCGSDGDCAEGEACVDPGGGAGRCALVPDLGVACSTWGSEESELPRVSGGERVRVCIDGAARCAAGTCVEPCASDAECTRPGAPRCDAVVGECGCASDADCVAPGASHCVAGACAAEGTSCGGDRM